MKRRIKTIFWGLLLFYCGAGAFAQDIRSAIVKIYTVHNLPDYYNPWNMRGTQNSTGSGCIIDGRRILTNGHVVRDQTFVQVRRFGDSRRYQARVQFVSHQADLALLTVDDPAFFAGVSPLSLGELPETQQEVNVYGFPMGGDTLSITKGTISRIEHQTYAHSSISLLAAQIDAAINPGNSGGPAIVDGKIVGVAMQGMPQAENIGYIVPVPVIEHFFKDIGDGRRNGIPDLGISWQKLENPDMRRSFGLPDEQTGVLIIRAAHESAADGILQPGDVLLRIDGHSIADDGTVEFRPKERTLFSYHVQKKQLNDPVELDVLRKAAPLKLTLKLSCPVEQSFLIPMEQYDILPTYYIYGGIVFAPLTKNLLQMWGRTWFEKAPRELVARLSDNLLPSDIDEVVLVLKVLASDVNQGYQNENFWQIESVDGKKVKNMKHLVDVNEAGGSNEFVTIESNSGLKLILDRNKVQSEKDSLLTTYRIPADRSANLIK